MGILDDSLLEYSADKLWKTGQHSHKSSPAQKPRPNTRRAIVDSHYTTKPQNRLQVGRRCSTFPDCWLVVLVAGNSSTQQ